MVPFVRTLDEAEQVIELLAEHGLRRGENGLEVIMMCELPFNAVLADEFLTTSTVLHRLQRHDPADPRPGPRLRPRRRTLRRTRPRRQEALTMAIQACTHHDKYVGICGHGPSDHPDFAEWLLSQGIQSMSLDRDSVIETWTRLAHVTPERPLPTRQPPLAGPRLTTQRPRQPSPRNPHLGKGYHRHGRSSVHLDHHRGGDDRRAGFRPVHHRSSPARAIDEGSRHRGRHLRQLGDPVRLRDLGHSRSPLRG